MSGAMLGWLRVHTRYGATRGRSNRRAGAAVAAALVAASPAQAQTIAAFGDSLTQGYGLREDEGFAARLEDWLRANGAEDAAVINAGVSGDTTTGGRARVGWVLADDVDAVLLALGANDMLRGLDPGEARANLDAILDEIAARGLPVLIAGIPGPDNYGPEYKAEFEAIFPDLAAAHDALYYPNFLAGLGAETLEAARPFMQDDGMHPNAEGVRAIVEDIGPLVLELVASED